MAIQINGQSQKTGAPGQPFPQDQQSNPLVTEANPRYYQNTYQALKFLASTAGGGVQLAATSLFSTAIATFTPILALYNPLTNAVNLVLTRIWCGLSAAPLATITQTGAFLLVGQSGQSLTNAQGAPINAKILKAVGSAAVVISNAVLAGAVGNPLLLRPLSADVELVTAAANVSGIQASIPYEETAGGIIIPPGGYVGIANGISNAVAGHLVTAGFEWDELPV
jgi:hypothetical protein